MHMLLFAYIDWNIVTDGVLKFACSVGIVRIKLKKRMKNRKLKKKCV